MKEIGYSISYETFELAKYKWKTYIINNKIGSMQDYSVCFLFIKRNGNMKRNRRVMDEINDILGRIDSQVKIENRQRDNRMNSEAEDLFCGLLNLIYNYNLINMNYENPNMPSIDLGDELQRVAVQVTSQNERKKIKESVEKFIRHKLNYTYDKLIVLIVGYIRNFRKFDESFLEVIGIDEIGLAIQRLDPERKVKILKYLRSYYPHFKSCTNEGDIKIKKGEYASFLQSFFYEEDRKTMKHYINDFAERLSQFDSRTRKLIYTMIKRSVQKKYDNEIWFSYYEIKKDLGWKNKQLVQELNILRNNGFIDTPNVNLNWYENCFEFNDKQIYEGGLIRLSYIPKNSEVELLNEIRTFLCKKHVVRKVLVKEVIHDRSHLGKVKEVKKQNLHKDFKKIIMKLDFTVLN